MGWEYFILLLLMVWLQGGGGRESPAQAGSSRPGTALLLSISGCRKNTKAGNAGDIKLNSVMLLVSSKRRRCKGTGVPW